MARTSTYLNFTRNTEEAFLFYKSVFKTEFTGPVVRFGEMPAPEGAPAISAADKNLVLHVELPICGGHVLMGTDAPESFGFSVTKGNNIHIQLEPDNREEADRLFEALAGGARITMPMQNMFWGAYFGSLTDKFGINWMINLPQQQL